MQLSEQLIYCESSYTQGDSTFFGHRCKLLGLLYAGPQHTSTGSIVFENISTNPKAVIKIIIQIWLLSNTI